MRADSGVEGQQLPAAQADELERQAVACTLEELGYVTRNKVTRGPRKRKRPSRECLPRALRKAREQCGEPVAADPAPAANITRPVEISPALLTPAEHAGIMKPVTEPPNPCIS